MALGEVTLQMGAGRTVAGADIDHAVGLRLLVQVGSKIEKGGLLFVPRKIPPKYKLGRTNLSNVFKIHFTTMQRNIGPTAE